MLKSVTYTYETTLKITQSSPTVNIQHGDAHRDTELQT